MPGIDECLLRAMTLPGARGAAVIDWTSGLALGMVGDLLDHDHDHETMAAETAELARMTAEYVTFAPVGSGGRGGRGEPADSAPVRGGCADSDKDVDVDDVDTDDVDVEDVIVTTHTCYHLLRFVRTAFDGSVFVHVRLDRRKGNLALARIRLRDVAECLVPA